MAFPSVGCEISHHPENIHGLWRRGFSDEKFQTQNTPRSPGGRVEGMRRWSRWARSRWECWHLIPGRILGQINGSQYPQDSAEEKLIMVWWQPWDAICNFSCCSSLSTERGGIPGTSLPWFRLGAPPAGHCWARSGWAFHTSLQKTPKIITQIQWFH